MNLQYFAHEGETHETTAEAQAHETQTANSVNIPFDAVVGICTLAVVVLFLLLAKYVLKLKFTTNVLVIMAALLVIGVVSYQNAPVTSVIALSVGFAMALGGMFLQLAPGKKRK